MGCTAYLGAMCILLEDLGFQIREPDGEVVKEMTYYCYSKMLYEKIFADVNKTWILEVCLVPEIMHVDRWRMEENGLYIISEEFSIDLYNPKGINKVSNFVEETITIARSE